MKEIEKERVLDEGEEKYIRQSLSSFGPNPWLVVQIFGEKLLCKEVSIKGESYMEVRKILDEVKVRMWLVTKAEVVLREVQPYSKTKVSWNDEDTLALDDENEGGGEDNEFLQ